MYRPGVDKEQESAVAAVEQASAVAVVEQASAVAVVEQASAVAAVEQVTAVAAVEQECAVAAVEQAPAVAAVEQAPAVAAVEQASEVAAVEQAPAVAEQAPEAAAKKNPLITMFEELAQIGWNTGSLEAKKAQLSWIVSIMTIYKDADQEEFLKKFTEIHFYCKRPEPIPLLKMIGLAKSKEQITQIPYFTALDLLSEMKQNLLDEWDDRTPVAVQNRKVSYDTLKGYVETFIMHKEKIEKNIAHNDGVSVAKGMLYERVLEALNQETTTPVHKTGY